MSEVPTVSSLDEHSMSSSVSDVAQRRKTSQCENLTSETNQNTNVHDRLPTYLAR